MSSDKLIDVIAKTRPLRQNKSLDGNASPKEEIPDSVGPKLSEAEKPQTKYVKAKQLTATQVVRFLSSSESERKDNKDSSEKKLEDQAKCVVGYRFQQAINCCQITATAYAFTCLGYPTSVDDIFLEVGVNVESAVGDGMTLAETHELAVRYIIIKKLPIFVDCYHLDDGSASVKDLERALISEGNSGINDVISLNFHSGIAHGKKRGGGHFSILVGYSQKEQEVVVADVHPMKYGAFWSTPLKQMFDAMNDKDSVGRSRGMLHFGQIKSDVSRPLPGLNRARSLLDWSSPIGHSKDVLLPYIPTRWGTLMGCRNMGGVSALALALNALEGKKCLVPELDDIMRSLKLSYTEHLNTFLTASTIVDISSRLIKLGLTTLKVSLGNLNEKVTGEVLRSALAKVNCGKEGVAVLVSYGMNQAQGIRLVKEDLSEAGALCHGAKTWSVLASFSPKAREDNPAGVVMASAYKSKLFGRLWTCPLENLAMGMAAIGSDSFVVLSRQPLSSDKETDL